jgi:potassium voltage-gated channel Shab-related subfamily B member 1
MWHTLARGPTTRLGRLARLRKLTLSSSGPQSSDEFKELCDDYNLSSEEFFFDRNPLSFLSIIEYYRTGKLHLIDDVCIMSFHDDLVYWGIDENSLELCCQTKYYEKKEYVLEEMRKEVDLLKVETETIFSEHFFPKTRQKLWNLFENSHTSKMARVCQYLSLWNRIFDDQV